MFAEDYLDFDHDEAEAEARSAGPGIYWHAAETKSGTRLTSVLALDEEHAKERLTEELQRPGRGHYYKQWKEDGFIIKLV